MPQRAKPRLSGPKRRCKNRASTAEPAAPNEAPAVHAAMQGLTFNAEARLILFAQLAWLDDYIPVLQAEAEENGAVDAVAISLSGYRARQLRKSPRADAAFWQSALRISRDRERLKREKNVHYLSFSQVHVHVMCMYINCMCAHTRAHKHTPLAVNATNIHGDILYTNAFM